MKHLLLALMLIPLFGMAQDSLNIQKNPPPPPPPSGAPAIKTNDLDKASLHAEIEPEFPGGQQAMIQFIVKNVKYPVIAKEAGIQGKVYVQFEVAPTGDLENIKIVRGVHPALDEEAIRVMKMMPKWKPGETAGKKVRVRMYLPIVFRLS